jgi:hypothetical protein
LDFRAESRGLYDSGGDLLNENEVAGRALDVTMISLISFSIRMLRFFQLVFFTPTLSYLLPE